MRVSTSYMFSQNLTAMLNQQTELGKTQLQISTGKRIISPSDDPAGSVQILNLQREFSITEQYLSNADKAENKQAIEEGALKSSTDILQRIRELAVQGLNATNAQSDRQAIAIELDQLNEQLLALANTRDSNGDYLFSGFKSNSKPYETINGSYQGDEGQRNMKVGAGVLIETNDPGNAIFEARHVSTVLTKTAGATNSNISIISSNASAELNLPLTFTFNAGIAPAGGYDVSDGVTTASIPYTVAEDGLNVDLSSLNPALPKMTITLTGTPSAVDSFTIDTTVTTQSMFKTIDQFSKALVANQVTANDGPNNGDFLTNIGTSIETVVDTQAKIGSRLNAIEHQRETNDGISLSMEKTLSQIKDLDYAEAISRLELQSLGLQAAQQTFSQVQRLSLFNFL